MRRAAVLAAVLALALTACAPPASETPAPPETPVLSEAPAVTPAPAPIQTPAPTPNSSLVYTDWSQLEDRPAPLPDVYERWHGKFTDHLIPSPDYGPLIPFSGTPLPSPWNGEYEGFALEGLMTLDGKVVVDPVYGGITQLGWGGNWEWGTLDGYHGAFLLTTRYAGNGENLFGGHSDMRGVLCAADGSWVTKEEYRFSYDTLCYGRIGENGALFALREDDTLVMLDIHTGEETFAVSLEGLSGENISDALSYAAYGDGRITTRSTYYDEGGYLQTSSYHCWDESGSEIPLPDDVRRLSGGFSDGLCCAQSAETLLWGYLDVNGQWAIPPQFDDVWSFSDGVALVGSHAHTLIDREGNILYEAPTYDHCFQSGDYWYFTGYSGDAGLVLDKQGNEIKSPLLHGGSIQALDYGWVVMDNADGSQLLARGAESWPIPAMWDDLWDFNVTEDAIYLTYSGEYAPGDSRPRWLMWRPGDGDIPHLYDPRVCIGSFEGVSLDPITGEQYLLMGGREGGYAALTPEGETLFDGLKSWPNLYGGRCLTGETRPNSHTVTLRSPKGEVLLRRTWEANFD